MIRIDRGAEPPEVGQELKRRRLDLMGLYYQNMDDPGGRDIDGYRIARNALFEVQHKKCCYCEFREQQNYNDVEHWRPKARADRQPGSSETHGYWWLAHTWQNLLFACADCNRSEKNDAFPLENGSIVLSRGQDPPGQERCVLIDPAQENGIKYIQFCYDPGLDQWRAKPRKDGDQRAKHSINVYGLNREGLIDHYDDHIKKNVKPHADALQEALKEGNVLHVQSHFELIKKTLLKPTQQFVGLSYDALQHFIPNEDLKPWGLAWPDLTQ